MPEHETSRPTLTRDQQRALYAYSAVGTVPQTQDKRDEYKTAVNDLGANILRDGLCAAIADVQRRKERGELLLEHLAGAASESVSGLHGVTRENLSMRVRELDTQAYMVATREMLRIATWLKRAVQASF